MKTLFWWENIIRKHCLWGEIFSDRERDTRIQTSKPCQNTAWVYVAVKRHKSYAQIIFSSIFRYDFNDFLLYFNCSCSFYHITLPSNRFVKICCLLLNGHNVTATPNLRFFHSNNEDFLFVCCWLFSIATMLPSHQNSSNWSSRVMRLYYDLRG